MIQALNFSGATATGFLTAAGCDEAQGYWFERPMNAEAIEVHLRALLAGA